LFVAPVMNSLVIALTAVSGPAQVVPSQQSIHRTEIALTEQIGCTSRPQVGRAINAMLKNGLILYVANESGSYLFAPNVPLNFLGLPIRHIAGFDREVAFRGVPYSRMIGTAPPQFLQLDIEAPADELKKRALGAGMVEAIPSEDKMGFAVEDSGHYLAGKSRSTISSIECAD
jgi:hypothetical protein